MSATRQGNGFAGIVGANIRIARNRLGLTQREFALQVGGKTSAQHISDWECGRVRPSDGNLVRIAEVAKQELAWFFVNNEDGVAA